ncbi:hypothetical protein D3A96_07575 [Robertkochia marina]|nr:hypothetical protein D3A96_07575 [Robertkochia marina]
MVLLSPPEGRGVWASHDHVYFENEIFPSFPRGLSGKNGPVDHFRDRASLRAGEGRGGSSSLRATLCVAWQPAWHATADRSPESGTTVQFIG